MHRYTFRKSILCKYSVGLFKVHSKKNPFKGYIFLAIIGTYFARTIKLTQALYLNHSKALILEIPQSAIIVNYVGAFEYNIIMRHINTIITITQQVEDIEA